MKGATPPKQNQGTEAHQIKLILATPKFIGTQITQINTELVLLNIFLCNSATSVRNKKPHLK